MRLVVTLLLCVPAAIVAATELLDAVHVQPWFAWPASTHRMGWADELVSVAHGCYWLVPLALAAHRPRTVVSRRLMAVSAVLAGVLLLAGQVILVRTGRFEMELLVHVAASFALSVPLVASAVYTWRGVAEDEPEGTTRVSPAGLLLSLSWLFAAIGGVLLVVGWLGVAFEILGGDSQWVSAQIRRAFYSAVALPPLAVAIALQQGWRVVRLEGDD